MIAGPPRRAVTIPPAVTDLADGGTVRAVWENQLGGTTFEILGGQGRRFVKWSPRGCGIDPRIEAARLAWAAPFTPVPVVLDHGRDEIGAWLLTEGLPGESAVSRRWRHDPGVAVVAIGEGLRALHEALPVDRCPFVWAAEDRVTEARRMAWERGCDPAGWHEDHLGLTVERALEMLGEIPPVDHPVVCHGDACAPNTLVGGDGRWVGHVDLGAMGVADRWADLAIATWSTLWNYGPGWEGRLLSAYGIAPDPQRTRYYRLLWDLEP
jgi:kanamycin kinase